MNIFTLIFRSTAGVQGINLGFEELKTCTSRINKGLLTSYVCCTNNLSLHKSKEWVIYSLVSCVHQAVSTLHIGLFGTFSQFLPGGHNDSKGYP
jgi:hypothetical protein